MYIVYSVMGDMTRDVTRYLSLAKRDITRYIAGDVKLHVAFS